MVNGLGLKGACQKYQNIKVGLAASNENGIIHYFGDEKPDGEELSNSFEKNLIRRVDRGMLWTVEMWGLVFAVLPQRCLILATIHLA